MMEAMGGALVLLHGFTQTGRSWDGVRAALGGRYRDVRAPDLRGHGTASAARPVTFDAVMRDVAALAPERFTLAGYSMGGRIALLFALAHPERVERLVLLGASPGIADPAERVARRHADEALARELERDGIEAWAGRWGAQPLFADQPREVAAAAHADRLRGAPAGLVAALRGLGTGVMTPVWDRLGELGCPVLLAAGERDAKFAGVAEAMGQHVARADVVRVAGAGHAAHLERHDAVAALF
jgi:2-succinyl-6-hydroxy-2,4-cyclohexadiene-1-carboxylate synthase